MKHKLTMVLFVIFLISAIIINSSVLFGASNIVSQNGQLKVASGKLCNASGTAIQLKGMSTYGLQWISPASTTITNLVNAWNITVIRAAMYTAENGYLSGSITDPASNPMTAKVKAVVDAAISNGIYAIIDWHILTDNDPNTNKDAAKTFFDYISKAYANSPNVLYEICNEPNGSASWPGITTYANYVIPTIRANSPNAIVIVGTDTWSQGVRNAANAPLSFSNICYSLHFYAGTHGASLRSEGDYALSKGAALFVSEWGATDASGNGLIYRTEAQNWIGWMATNKISWCNWAFCNQNEGFAALVTSASMNGPWTDSNLTASGLWVKSKLAGSGPTPTVTPAKTATPTKNPTPGGTTPTPASGGIKVQMYNANKATSAQSMNPQFRLVNTGASVVTLSTVMIRYYYTIDNSVAQTFTCDYCTIGTGNVTGSFAGVTGKTGSDYYLQVGFTSAAGNLAPGTSIDIHVRFNKNDWSNYTQTNDYSFNSTGIGYANWIKATGYISWALKWGTEP